MVDLGHLSAGVFFVDLSEGYGVVVKRLMFND